MKYAAPALVVLFDQASLWCNVGSNGESCCNDCGGGGAPSTTQCKGGSANTAGHCITGTSVSNQGAATFCYKGSGATGSNPNSALCNTGTQATGYKACSVGASACHCYTGSKA